MEHLVSASATEKITVEFPNLFNGTEITYTRGFELFGQISIFWYGILIAVGIFTAYIYATIRCDKVFGLPKGRFFDVVFASVIGGFLGARIYFCVFTTLDPNSGTKYDFITTFTRIHDGGLAIYGGIIGAFLVGFIMCKIRKVNFFATCDVAALGFLIGQTIGRWGNFINQEAYGSACDENWLFAMKGTIIGDTPVHPCFLYESAWCLLGFILLHIYSKKLRSFDGEIMLLYLSWYGLGRFFIEGNRSDSLMAGSLKISQIVAAVCFICGITLFIVFKIITKKKKIPLYVNTERSKELIAKEKQDELDAKAKREAKKNKKAPSILEDNAQPAPRPVEKTEDSSEAEEVVSDDISTTDTTEVEEPAPDDDSTDDTAVTEETASDDISTNDAAETIEPTSDDNSTDDTPEEDK